ncbi:sensor domain-containing diguanylate cyclase [Agaribacter marinus]|uniref:diguanylate cyclase n=1 Tax=Agaribacter marinus TaxID=1431249 RepID=A0AA37T1V1_9ALTE|nr:diguanylate cyclase [Agaribacter marinus]GLR72354.1 deoxynucleoside kinase [Agaribacter marinus]
MLAPKSHVLYNRVLQSFVKHKNQYILASFVALTLYVLFFITTNLSDIEDQHKPYSEVFYLSNEVLSDDVYAIKTLDGHHWELRDNLNFGMTDKVIWIKVKVNPKQTTISRIIRFQDPLVNVLNVWVFESGSNKLFNQLDAGDASPFNQRDIENGSFLVDIGDSSRPLDIYIRAQTNLGMNLSFSFWRASDFIAYNSDLTLFYGGVFGYAFAIFFFSLMMYATTQNIEYVFYSGYVASFSIHLAAVTGFGFQYIWPNAPNFQQLVATLSFNLTFFFIVLFTRHFVLYVGNKEYASLKNSWQAKVFTFIAFTYVALIFASAIWQTTFLLQLSILLLNVSIFGVVYICFTLARQGFKNANFFVWVWFGIFITVLLVTLNRLILNAVGLDPTFILIIGFFFETLVIGAALVLIYNRNKNRATRDKLLAIKDERKMLSAKDELLALQADAKQKLELEVKQQTARLESALKDLSKASKDLKQLRNVDSLTSLPNRFMFEELVQKNIVVSVRTRCPIAIAVIDIDCFKAINDEYGHIGGDEVLKHFAQLLLALSEIHGFDVCRFGGEEFVVLAVNFDNNKLLNVIDRFRLDYAKSKIHIGDQYLYSSFSAGISSAPLDSQKAYLTLLGEADKLLYRAKQKGRNRVLATA